MNLDNFFSQVYMWSESGAMIIKIPHANFNAKQLIWSKAGKSFILIGKDKCSVAYLDCPAALNSEKENIPTDQMKQGGTSIIAGKTSFSHSTIRTFWIMTQVRFHLLLL